MPDGTPVPRHCTVILNDGRVVVDRGSQLQDLMTGEFLPVNQGEFSRPAQDSELEAMAQAGLIAGFDAFQVYLYPLPEAFTTPLD